MPRGRAEESQNWGVFHRFVGGNDPHTLVDVELDDITRGPLSVVLLASPGTDHGVGAVVDYAAQIDFGSGGVGSAFYCDFKHGVGIALPASYVRVTGRPNPSPPSLRNNRLGAYAIFGAAGHNFLSPTWTVNTPSVAAGATSPTLQWDSPINLTVAASTIDKMPPFAQALYVFPDDAKADQYTVMAVRNFAETVVDGIAFYSSNLNQGQEHSVYPTRIPLPENTFGIQIRNDNPGGGAVGYTVIFEIGF